MMNVQTFLISILVSLAISGCGTHTGNGVVAKLSTSLRNASSVTPAAEAMWAMRAISPAGMVDRLAGGQTVGQTTATSLTSMKYNVLGISLCQSLTTSGSGFSDEQGCINVYAASPNPAFSYNPEDDYSNLADAARNNPSAMTDLMNSSARTGLSTTTTLTSQNVGAYKYGIITWSPVVEVTGDITVGGTVYRTSDGTVSGAPYYKTTSTADFTSATSDSNAAVVLDNGGNWFAFQNPFVISADDISAGTNFAVDLTFNPDGMMRAFPADIANGCATCDLFDASGNGFEIPELGLVPIARHATDTTMKEVYQGSVTGTSTGGTDNFDLRVELYYVQSDSAKTIYGTNIRVLPNASSNTYVPPFPTISFLETNTDSTISFQLWDKSVVLDEFARATEVGDTTQATIHCGTPGMFSFQGCGTPASTPTTSNVTLTLTSISSLD